MTVIFQSLLSSILKKTFRHSKGRQWPIIEKDVMDEIIFKTDNPRNRLMLELKNITADERIFPLGYTRARQVVKKAGRKIGVEISPHDLRRHAATYASRSGAPIEIVSKIILRHANFSTTQRYLGKVTDSEAMRWIESIFS